MKKKKILFLTDDPRFNSGIATVSKEIIINLVHKYDFVIVGGSAKHPDEGKVIDLSESLQKDFNIPDAYAKIYPVTGYGTPDLIRNILLVDQPDLILHFTDPRYWTWLYDIEHEIRQFVPLTYLTIWDCPPAPMYNKPYYLSCDLLMCISRQTYGLVHKVLKGENYQPWQIKYVPHGLNHNVYKPILESDPDYKLVVEKRKSLSNSPVEFVLFLNSRNIRRKQIPDAILGFRDFVRSLPKEKQDGCVFLLHTQPIDENGTNLIELCNVLAPDINIVFSAGQLSHNDMNILYNVSDVVINVSSNEGWGLSITEARLAGKPVIVNMTGGLQDQIGLKEPLKYEYINESHYLSETFDSNHKGYYKDYDGYAKAIVPSNLSIQGSVPTPYIYDDRVKIEDITAAIKYWYEMPVGARKILGNEAREKAIAFGHTGEHMSKSIDSALEDCLNNWTPRKRFNIYKV